MDFDIPTRAGTRDDARTRRKTPRTGDPTCTTKRKPKPHGTHLAPGTHTHIHTTHNH